MIRVGIYGYGNLGRGVENAIRQNRDMELVAVFTRRDPSAIALHTPGAVAAHASEVEAWRDRIRAQNAECRVMEDFRFARKSTII